MAFARRGATRVGNRTRLTVHARIGARAERSGTPRVPPGSGHPTRAIDAQFHCSRCRALVLLTAHRAGVSSRLVRREAGEGARGLVCGKPVRIRREPVAVTGYDPRAHRHWPKVDEGNASDDHKEGWEGSARSDDPGARRPAPRTALRDSPRQRVRSESRAHARASSVTSRAFLRSSAFSQRGRSMAGGQSAGDETLLRTELRRRTRTWHRASRAPSSLAFVFPN